MVFKICPACGKVFACQPENPERCQCSKVSLTKEQRASLARRFSTCLCAECLKTLAET